LLKLACASLAIYIRDKNEETERLSKFFYFLKTILNEKKKFLPHFLESEDWLDKVKWNECHVHDCDKCAKSKHSDKPINISDENTGMSLNIKIYENYRIDILIDRRLMMFEGNNTCLEWHHKFITLLVEENIVDVGCIFPGLPKDNPRWYTSKYNPSFCIGKRNFLILAEFHGVGLFYEERKKILTDFIQKNWDELNQKDNILISLNKERKNLLKEARSSFFSKLFDLGLG